MVKGQKPLHFPVEAARHFVSFCCFRGLPVDGICRLRYKLTMVRSRLHHNATNRYCMEGCLYTKPPK